MNLEVNNNIYEVIIIKKKNKNTYIRINDKMQIVLTTNYLMPKYKIKQLLSENIKTIEKMIKNKEKNNKKNDSFYYLGKKYDIIINENVDKITITQDKIYTKDLNQLDKWLKREIKKIFTNRLDEVYKRFTEKIAYPDLKIRTMKTRWGVCNKKGYITLNSNLIRYDISVIDYVIIHELSHYIHFNHSKEFWNAVSKYCPNYKEYKKILKD